MRVLVPVANGSEEMETVILVDVLRRAGAEVMMASVEPDLQIVASRRVKISADVLIKDCQPQWDLIALPGGMPGAERLAQSAALVDLLKAQFEAGAPVAAVCAAPAIVLARHGLIGGRKVTCHPNFSDKLSGACQYDSDSFVVRDGNLITSQGPGTCMAFALTLVKILFGKDKAQEIAQPMIVAYP